MARTCLQIVQSACRRIGILSPNAAMTSSDPLIQQMVEIANEEGRLQCSEYSWQALQREAKFTTVALEIQGALSTIAPDLEWISNNTIWNRTLRRPVYGPDSQQDWQQAKAMQINGPFNRFRIIASNINFYPVPVAGQSCYFEYQSNGWVRDANGLAWSVWKNDSDVTVLDDELVILGTIWRWKSAKGLAYSDDYAKYEKRLTDSEATDGSKPTLSMGGAKYDIQPGIFVPAGSWGV